jgi:hypothetical protein
MEYPKPDRSNYKPNFRKTAENPQLDIGWAEGRLTDGRPYRMEAWCEDQVTMVTFFFASAGLERLTNRELQVLLEQEELLHFTSSRRHASAMQITDAAGAWLWSVSVVIGDEDGLYAGGGPMVQPYGER